MALSLRKKMSRSMSWGAGLRRRPRSQMRSYAPGHAMGGALDVWPALACIHKPWRCAGSVGGATQRRCRSRGVLHASVAVDHAHPRGVPAFRTHARCLTLGVVGRLAACGAPPEVGRGRERAWGAFSLAGHSFSLSFGAAMHVAVSAMPGIACRDTASFDKRFRQSRLIRLLCTESANETQHTIQRTCVRDRTSKLSVLHDAGGLGGCGAW